MAGEDTAENMRPLLGEEDMPEEGSNELDDDLSTEKAATLPFKRWMNSFRIRKRIPPTIPERVVEGWQDLSQPDIATENRTQLHDSTQEQRWEISSGQSSHLGTVKTATMSTASRSVARSRANTQSTTNQSTASEVRVSADSSRPTSGSPVDEAADQRAMKRRQLLQEVVSTEADYVQGLTALAGILPMLHIRPQIYYNILKIREIHECFLAQLQTISPMSAGPIPDAASDFVSRGLTKRLGTMDLRGLKALNNRSLRTRKFKEEFDRHLKTLVAEPMECLEVVREIDKLSLSFSVYEEFCSNYELLTQDVAILRRPISNWAVFEQGIEALSKSVASTEARKHEDNRSMLMNDLMIKPIQRLCKYPLLLQDLLRSIPIGDCPTSHNEIRQVLESLRIMVARINSATGNPVNKDRIHKTILLQAKIDFSETEILQDVYRELGPMTLCGVLHVAYKTREQTIGDFMVCVLFSCYFLLAKGNDDSRRLKAVACIYIDDLKMDTVQNGRGLFCYGCPYSWKLIFHEQEDNFEFVLSASSAVEERHWKTEILRSSASLGEMARPGGAWDPRRYSFVNIALVPLDRIQYAVSSLARRSSMDSMSIARKCDIQQVVIKKTHYPNSHDEPANPPRSEIERLKTQVIRSTSTITARRIDRVRLEKTIANIYTRDVLPFPGMVLARGESFRHGSLMRRLSFHGGFNRRPISLSTAHTGPILTDGTPVDEYNCEGKESMTGHDGCDEQQSYSPAMEYRSSKSPNFPKTPTAMSGRSKTLRLRGSRKQLGSVASSPRSEKRSSQGSAKLSPTRKKWSSPLSLFGALSPKGPEHDTQRGFGLGGAGVR